MINAVLVFNNNGQPRLTKFYSQIDVPVQQRLLTQIFNLVANRPATACNFLPLPPLLAGTSTAFSADNPTRVIYRHYATLYFIIISDDLESELGLLDLIQVFVEALDRLFENVCELDIIFNFETLHQVLAEMVQGGCVVETDLSKVVTAVKEAKGVVRRPVGGGGIARSRARAAAGGGPSSGDAVWTGR